MNYQVHIEEKKRHKSGNRTYFTKLQSVIQVCAIDETHAKSKIYCKYGLSVKIINIYKNDK